MAGRIYVEGNELVLTMMEDDVRTVPLHTEPEYVGDFDSPEDAGQAAEEWLSAQGGTVLFGDAGGDLSSISYHYATVWEDVRDDDGEPLECTAVGYLDDLTDDLLTIWDQHVAEVRRLYYGDGDDVEDLDDCEDDRIGCRHMSGRGA